MGGGRAARRGIPVHRRDRKGARRWPEGARGGAVRFVHDPVRAMFLAERYWPAFREGWEQTGSLAESWRRLTRVSTTPTLLDVYAPLVRDILCAWVVAKVMPPIDDEHREEGRMAEVQVDAETMRLIEKLRGPLTAAQYIKAAVYQFAYANRNVDRPP